MKKSPNDHLSTKKPEIAQQKLDFSSKPNDDLTFPPKKLDLPPKQRVHASLSPKTRAHPGFSSAKRAILSDSIENWAIDEDF